MDRFASVWTRTRDGPEKMGSLVATPRQTRYSYDPEFLARGRRWGLSLLADPQRYRDRPLVHRASEALPLPARLLSLIPPRQESNLQRRFYAQALARRKPPPAPGFETDWELLMLAGRNGIGHLDLFRDDRQALAWYGETPDTRLSRGRSGIWRALRNELEEHAAGFADKVAPFLGPTPSVGGMIPKLLLALPDPDLQPWNGEVTAPGRGRSRPGLVEVVLKIENTSYAGMLALETLCLDLHAACGFEVPRHWLLEHQGLKLLAVERFDRDPDGLPMPLESFFSLMATQGVTGSADTEMERVGRMLQALGGLVDLDVRAAAKGVYRRFLLALLTGNGDLHLDNLSLLGGPEAVRLAPVYDPAPMRAWARHDLLSAIPFEIEGGLRESILRLGASFGLGLRAAESELEKLAAASADYGERLAGLTGVPAENLERLQGRVGQLRRRLELD